MFRVWCGAFVVSETMAKCFYYFHSHRELISRSQTETHRMMSNIVSVPFCSFCTLIRQSNSNRFEIQSSQFLGNKHNWFWPLLFCDLFEDGEISTWVWKCIFDVEGFEGKFKLTRIWRPKTVNDIMVLMLKWCTACMMYWAVMVSRVYFMLKRRLKVNCVEIIIW